MFYEKDLQFFKRLLEQLHLPVIVYHMQDDILDTIDMGLRRTLSLETETYRKWEGDNFSTFLAENVIYYLTDEFCCQYAFLRLPAPELSSSGTEHTTLFASVTDSTISSAPSLSSSENVKSNRASTAVLMVGPYKTEESKSLQALFLESRAVILRNWLPILKNYYERVPYLAGEDVLFAAFNALAEQFWGPQNFRSEKIVQGIPESWVPVLSSDTADSGDSFLTDIKALEKSYGYEKNLMYEVAHGHTHQVQVMLSNIPVHSIANRTDPVRNLKNYSIILNTLLRKAAEQGGVHPLSIDKLSSEYAQKIESMNRRDAFFEMWNEMAQKYCQLVNKHSIEKYNQLIQKVLLRIEFNLSSDLSLSNIAKMFNVNASYLSSLFGQEVGVSLTDYVNKKRMEYAVFLLSSTSQPISMVAQSCGIHDDNYFTKLFKKYNGKTPTAFRKEHAPL